jgi:hypothetical protein
MGNDDPVAEAGGHSRVEAAGSCQDDHHRSWRQAPFESIVDEVVRIAIIGTRDDALRSTPADISYISSADENGISLNHEFHEHSPVAIVAKSSRSTNRTFNADPTVDAGDEPAVDE